MSSRPRNDLLKYIRRFAALHTARKLNDRDLLERFVAANDEFAFLVLVERHGSMVHGVCRRVLRNVQDAEDACQATFLVLARKAASIRRHTSTSSWLHGVACRVSASLRRERSRRQRYEQQAEPAVPQEPGMEVTRQEAQVILDEELERLPERYRAPLILCYLDGKTRDEAARHLGLTPGILHGRLERGRRLLRERLIRRGLSSTAVLAAMALGDIVSQASQSPTFVLATAKVAALLAAGQPLVKSAVPVHVLVLAQEVVKSMLLTKLKAATAMTLYACLLTVSVSATLTAALGEQETKSPAAPVRAAPKESDEEFIRRMSQDLRRTDPTPTEVHFFVASVDPGKRQKLIDLFIAERQVKQVGKPVKELTFDEFKAHEERVMQARRELGNQWGEIARVRQQALADQIEINLRDESWDKVFQWLSNRTFLPVTVLAPVDGKFTFVSPKRNMKYSLQETISILNECLSREGRLLTWRKHRFTVIDLSKLDPNELEFLVNPRALANYGDTEIVRLAVQLKFRSVGDVGPAIKKMLGPYGDVVAVASTDHLFLQDTVGNLKRICNVLQEIDKR
jgi:RNA polymerase sigma factor (sigma-70 family)